MKQEENKDKILLFIPMYNCENQIVRVLKQVTPEILNHINEVIAVNNISTDSTEDVVKKFSEENQDIPIKIIRNKSNYGLGGSHKVAFSYAKKNNFDYVIVLHGDDQGDINDLVGLLETGKYRKYDSCLGARFHKGSKLANYSAFRTFGNRVYNLFFSIGIRKKVYDLGSGLNLYKVASLESDYYKKFPDNLTFNYCMIMAIQYYNQKVHFFPISWREDDQVSNVKLFSQAIKVLSLLGGYLVNKSKFMTTEHREVFHEEYEYTLISKDSN